MKDNFVCVDWVDTTCTSGWRDISDLEFCKPCKCRTVGHRLKGGKGFVRIALSKNNINDCSDVKAIPRSCVVSIKKLEIK